MSEGDNNEAQEDSRPVTAVEGREAMRAALIDVIGKASRRLLILSQCLESGLYRDRAVVDAFKQQVLSQPRLEVKLIISDPKLAIQQAERLIELARRVNSKFEFREPIGSQHCFEQEVVIADRTAYFYRDRPDNLIAKHGRKDPVGAHDLKQEFDARWQNSQPAAEFRRLG